MADKKKILIVDDEPQLAEFVKTRLEANNYSVASASDGIEGLKKAEETSPDLILLDIQMPNMDGFETLRILSMRKSTKSIPVIMLTAKDDSVDVMNAIDIGAKDYIAKPFEIRTLLDKINKQINMLS